MTPGPRTKWYALALICIVQFMTILDIAIVNVALPSIQKDLGFSEEDLQWVISAYALMFGGLLLLGGRLGDRLGRRRVFFAGTLVFTFASLLAGLSWSDETLLLARGLQGIGAALLTPSALAILTATFAEGRERNIALGVWGATGGFGAAAGVLLGGILTDLLSWEWIFFVNIPVGIVGLILTPILVQESRDLRTKTFDAVGAVLITASLTILVLAITQATRWGWGSATTWAVFAVAGVLFGLFLLWERGREEPLIPVAIFRVRTVLGANISGFGPGTIRLRDVPPAHAVHAADPRTHAARDRVRVPGGRRHGDHLGQRCRAADEPRRRETGDARRDEPDARRAAALHAAVGRRLRTWTDLFPGFLVVGLGMPFCFVPMHDRRRRGSATRRPGWPPV